MILPSHFNSYGDRRPRPIAWKDIYARITSTTNEVYTKTRMSREAKAKGDVKEAARLKSSMGFFTPAVQMQNGRKEQDIVAFTGECMCDFDYISKNHINLLIQRVSQDPHTRLCHITNSQEGIRIIFSWKAVSEEGEILPDDFFQFAEQETHEQFIQRCLPYHQKAWQMGNLYYQKLLDGAEIDEHCKDPNRISFYCHDLHAYYNEKTEPFMIPLGEHESLESHESNHEIPSSLNFSNSLILDNKEDNLDVDESIILRLLDSHPYKPSHRHGFWLKLGFRLKYFKHSKAEFQAYKEAALKILSDKGLILADDPSTRLENEIENCLDWGFTHGSEKELRNLESRNLGIQKPTSKPLQTIQNPSNPSNLSEPATGEDEIITSSCPLFPDEVYMNLPQCLLDGLSPVLDYSWDSLSSKPSALSFKEKIPRRRADALLLSLLTNYSVLCSNTHLLYGDRDYSPNLGFLCLAPAGNGKSVIEYGFRIIESTDRYLEKISNEEHKAWEEQTLAWEQAKGNQGNKEFRKIGIHKDSEVPKCLDSEVPQRPGDEPQMQMLAMPGTTSRSQFTICMNAMGKGGLIMNSTEINTLISTLKLDVGNFVDLLCKAMMNEQITQFFKIDNKPIKIKHPKLSVCMSGTFDQFHNFIRSIEDGLYSRFFILMMEQHTEWISQKPDPQRGDYSDVFNRLSDDALQMWLMLNENPTWTIFTDEQWEHHTSHYTAQTEQLVREGSGDRAAILNRHGLGQMRIASVLTDLRKWELYKSLEFKAESLEKRAVDTKGDFQSRYRVMVCRDDDYKTASIITDCLLPHALHLSTTMTAARQKHVQPMRQWRWVDDALSSLPKKFTIKQWLDMAEQMGRSVSQAYRSINTMEHHGKVRQKCENNTRTYYKSE